MAGKEIAYDWVGAKVFYPHLPLAENRSKGNLREAVTRVFFA
jgi:hypothetical protein